MDELDHVLFGRRTTVAEVHAHAAQADFRNRDAALSESALFHFCIYQKGVFDRKNRIERPRRSFAESPLVFANSCRFGFHQCSM